VPTRAERATLVRRFIRMMMDYSFEGHGEHDELDDA
jgi:hypothetical protein